MTNLFKLPRDAHGSAEALPSVSTQLVAESAERKLEFHPVDIQKADIHKIDIHKLDLHQILGEEVHLNPESRLVFHSEPRSCAADRFRFLRMRLRELWVAGKLKTLLVTSPLPEDGKSTTAVNLASALADHGRSSVLLIEADLYHSPLVDMLGIEPGPGLAECLESDLNPAAAIRRLQPLGWFLLPAGKVQGNPTELLQSEKFALIMQKLISCFDWVLIDSPPVVPLIDALLLKRHANATLLVARAGQTPGHAIEKSLSLLGREHVLGVVLNAVEGLNRLYSKYSNYYSSERPKGS